MRTRRHARALTSLLLALLLAPGYAFASARPSPALLRAERLARVESAGVSSVVPPSSFVPGRSRYPRPVGVVRYDQADPRITYSASWSSASVSYAYRRTIALADRPAALDVAFVGTGIGWLAITGRQCGIARVSVDGGVPAAVDLYRARPFCGEKVWAIAGLAPGLHHLRVEWTGDRNAGAADDLVTIDGFDVAGTLVEDSVPPVTSNDVTTGEYVDEAVVHLAATDDGLGVACTTYRIDEGEWETGTVATCDVLGEHALAYGSVDLAGNREDTKSVTFRIVSSDIVPPFTVTDATDVPAIETATVTMSATDDRTGVACTMHKVDDGEWTTGTVATISGAGEHVLAYRSVDLAGNVEQTRTVVVPVAHRYYWDDPQLRYEGNWSPHGPWTETWFPGSVTATFTGTRIAYRSDGRAMGGMVEISVDGGDPFWVDVTRTSWPDWSSGSLPYGRHVVRISWTGEPGAGSFPGWPEDTYISLYAFDVVGALTADSRPIVSWSDRLTPPEGATLYSDPDDPATTLVSEHDPAPWSSPPASLVASADANAAWPPLTRVRMSVDATPGFPAIVLAEWTPGSRTFVNDGSAGFDPFAIVLPLSPVPGQPYIPDGRRRFRVEVWDASGAHAEDVRMLRVDNHVPNGFAPGSPTSLGLPARNTDRFASGLEIGWAPPLDGVDLVDTYVLALVSPVSGAAISGPLRLGSTGSECVTSGALMLRPFTLYQARLTPLGPRLPGVPSVLSTLGATAPQLTGTVFNLAPSKKNPPYYRFGLAITAPPPGFAAAFGGASIVYDVYSVRSSTYTYPGGGDLPGIAILEYLGSGTTIQFDSGPAGDKYLQVEARVLAADGITEIRRFRSNVVGPPAVLPSYLSSAPLTLP